MYSIKYQMTILHFCIHSTYYFRIELSFIFLQKVIKNIRVQQTQPCKSIFLILISHPPANTVEIQKLYFPFLLIPMQDMKMSGKISLGNLTLSKGSIRILRKLDHWKFMPGKKTGLDPPINCDPESISKLV